MKGEKTKEFEEKIKYDNGFVTLSMSSLQRQTFLNVCSDELNKAGATLLSCEILRDGDQSFTIELEFAWSTPALLNAFNLGVLFGKRCSDES